MTWTAQQALTFSYKLCESRGLKEPAKIKVDNFLEYSGLVLDICRDLTSAEREVFGKHLEDFLRAFLTLRDDFEAIRQADPMVCYKPKHHVAEAFHRSNAFVRYFRAGNRTSKTQSGYAEHYMVCTGQTRFRDYGPHQGQLTFIISGLPYTIYAQRVFEAKFIAGEPDNELSPMFPEGGKWFNHYDSRTRTITIACPDCAEMGKAGSCKHQNRSRILLVSSELGVSNIEAFKSILCHIDEHVPDDFFPAAMQRIVDTPKSGMIVTATPYSGLGTWEEEKLTSKAEGPAELNLSDPDDKSSPKFCELFQIDQFAAGIALHSQIKRNMQSLDDFEIEARVYGRPAALAKHPVFDRFKLAELRKRASEPRHYSLTASKPLTEVEGGDDIKFVSEAITEPKTWTGVRVWEKPQRNAWYVAGIDTAAGLVKGDASVCTILKVKRVGMRIALQMVAQFWGHIGTFDYGRECFKLCAKYNDALAVIETTGGFGDAVMQVMKDELAYWSIFRDRSTVLQAQHALDGRLGVDTNKNTKPLMVSSAQQFLNDDCLEIPCTDTIEEMARYEQEMTGVGGAKLQTPRFAGAGGSKDDRVMSVCMAAGVVVTNLALFPVDEAPSIAEM